MALPCDMCTAAVHVGGKGLLCRHHQAYVRKLKEALRKAPELLDKDLNQLMQSVGTVSIWHPEVDQDIRNHGGGTRRQLAIMLQTPA